nr:AP-1 complex subunit sigma-3 [Vicugna pacos]
MGQSEMFGLYPVRSRIVLVDTLTTRNAWINLTYLDLEDHLGQNQAAQKGSFLIEGSPSETGRGDLPEARCPPAAGGFGPNIHFILLFSRQGKLRLQKWYTTLPDKERKKITREIVQIILSRGQRTSSFVDWKELKLVYKRYASLYFCCAVENQDNELLTLEIVHRYVELLDKYFGNVCELDIIFNFEKAYFILDEFIMGGEIQETSKKSAVKAIEDSDMLQETMEEYMNKPTF